MSNGKKFDLFVSRLSSSPLSRRSQPFQEEPKSHTQIIDRRKRRYSEMEQFNGNNPKLHSYTIAQQRTRQEPMTSKENQRNPLKEQPVLQPKPIVFPSKDDSPSNAFEDNSVNLLHKFLSEDQQMILSDSLIASDCFTPCVKDLNDIYLIKARIKYPETFYQIFQSCEKEKYAFSDIFTSLNVVYFVKENSIYFWNYVSNYQTTYSEIANPIINVHFTLPKQGVFSSSVSYILVVATKQEVLILLIKQTGSNSFEIYKSDFYYNPNGVVITSIASTSSRRIFLGGEDNLIWELDYANSASFFGFGKKTKTITRSSRGFLEKLNPFSFYSSKHSYFHKMVVDNTRHLLYAIAYSTNKEEVFHLDSVIDSSVTVYDLGPNDCDFIKLGEIDEEAIKSNFRQNIIGLNKKNQNYTIVDAICLTRADHKYNQLLLITRNGIRVYVKFDTQYDSTPIKDEALINEIDSNLINRQRIVLSAYYIPKPIPEPALEHSSSFQPESSSGDWWQSNLRSQTSIKKVVVIGKKTFVCYDDEVSKMTYVDVIEPDTKALNKTEGTQLYSNPLMKEISSNVFYCNSPCEVIHIAKLPERASEAECDLFCLLKRSSYCNFLYPNIKFLDSEAMYSYTCMHENCTQMFLAPEEYMLTTNIEAIYLMKLRPIDLLYAVITEVNSGTTQLNSIEKFIALYGIYETTFMLLYIMSNVGFIFYQKKQRNVVKDNSQLNYTQEYIETKNCERVIALTTKHLYQIIDMTVASINSIQANMMERQKTQGIYSAKPFLINEPPNGKQDTPYGHAFIDKGSKIDNYLTHAMFSLVSRVIRLFWEETLFYKEGFINDYRIEETMKLHQLQYLKNLVNAFNSKMREIKDPLMQRAADLEVKMRNIENHTKMFNQSQQGLQDKQPSTQLPSFVDFSNFKEEYLQVVALCEKTVEILSFVEIIYESLASQPQLTKRSFKELTMIRFKDIFQGKMPFVLKALLDRLYEIILNENDSNSIGAKLSRMTLKCPNILNPKQIELIKANLLLKYSKRTSNQDTITKKNIIDKAVKLMLSNAESIRIDKVIDNLCEISEVRQVIALCVTKAVYLKAQIDKEANEGISFNSNLGRHGLNESKSFSEYKECLYTIMKLLSELNNAIVNEGFIPSKTEPTPQFVSTLLKDKSKEQLVQMRSDIMEEILTYDVQFIHELLFEHLSDKNMVDDLFKINSPYVELYLNSQIDNDSTDPKRYESLYKFYLNSKNYEAAIRILLRLVNYDNKPCNGNSQGRNVRLEDRRVYNKHLLYALVVILEAETDPSRRKIFNDLKVKMAFLDETLSIQFEIKSWLDQIRQGERYDNNSRSRDIDEAIGAVLLLDQSKYSLEELYFDFAKRFKLYEVNFRIYFEMHSRQISVSANEVKENIVNCFKLFKVAFPSAWKERAVVLLNQILITFIQIKTPYASFYSMLKENDFANCLERIVPLPFLIETIEAINRDAIIQDEFMSYSFEGGRGMTEASNHFWLITYLKESIQLPMWYIYSVYSTFEAKEMKGAFVLMLSKLMIVNHWCDNVKECLTKLELKRAVVYSQVYSDMSNFIEKREELRDFMKELEEFIEEKDLLLFLNGAIHKEMKLFYQAVKAKVNEATAKLEKIKEATAKKIFDIIDMPQINEKIIN